VITNFSYDKGPVRVRIRFQVGYQADLEKTKEITLEAINGVEGVLKDTGQIVVRSLWDDARGHQMAGVLLEARYRVEDVRRRTTIRSEVLEKLLQALQKNNVPLAAQPILFTNAESAPAQA
ncbi:MAG: hypothetical protein ACYTHM_22860, partial [Planctomycetota bacterium]